MRYMLRVEGYEGNINDTVRRLRDVRGYTVKLKGGGKEHRRIAGLDEGVTRRILDITGADRFRLECINS